MLNPDDCSKRCNTFHYCQESGKHCDIHCVCLCEPCKQERENPASSRLHGKILPGCIVLPGGIVKGKEMGNRNFNLTIGDLVEKRYYNWYEFVLVATPPVEPGNPLIRIPGLMMFLVLACDDPTGVWRMGKLWQGYSHEVVRKLANVEEILQERTIESFLQQLGRIDLTKLKEGPAFHKDVLND